MKLVIHCGLHKTGTTSFQTTCAENRDLLCSLGVHYPQYGERIQHSYVLWELQKHGIGVLRDFLFQAFSDAKGRCHTVLLSGEDFENCIVDVALAEDIEKLAAEAGFDHIEWIVIRRSLDELLPSLYGELSRHGVVVQLNTLERSARERGCFYLSSPNYNYIFVLDFASFESRFKERVFGKVIDYDFHAYLENFPGEVILKRYLSGEGFENFKRRAMIDVQRRNERRSEAETESRYIATFLGFKKPRNRFFRFLAAPLIYIRLRNNRLCQRGRV